MQSSCRAVETARTYTLSFLLLPGFSVHSLQAALAPLQQLNEAFKQPPVLYQLLSSDAAQRELCQQHGLICEDYQYHRPRQLIICAGQQWPGAAPELLCWLRQRQRSGCTFYSLAGGCLLLASAGLLSTGEVSVGGAMSQQLRQRYPGIQITEAPYHLDWQRCTAGSCVDGFAAGDMLMEVVARTLAPGPSKRLAQQRVASTANKQDPRLERARALMLDSLSTPLNNREIAAQLALSARQLERLFQRDFQCSPGRYYLQLRLQQARKLVRYEHLNMQQIAIDCGFKSLSHFSRSYSKHYNISPKRERLMWHSSAHHVTGRCLLP
ncbi:MAG: helix-turn-helix domain-containing protein [Pseudomonadales bacterium]